MRQRIAARITAVQRGRDGKRSRAKFAEEIGADSHSTVGEWCNAKRLPSGEHLRAIGARTGVSLDWLLFPKDGEDDSAPVQRGQTVSRSDFSEEFVRQLLADWPADVPLVRAYPFADGALQAAREWCYEKMRDFTFWGRLTPPEDVAAAERRADRLAEMVARLSPDSPERAELARAADTLRELASARMSGFLMDSLDVHREARRRRRLKDESAG